MTTQLIGDRSRPAHPRRSRTRRAARRTTPTPGAATAARPLAPAPAAAPGPNEAALDAPLHDPTGDRADGPLDAQALDTVVTMNLGLADGIAARYVGRGIDRDDLVQVARLGLIKAARRFRPGVGQSFAGFAIPTIAGEIKRYFRDSGWMIRPPRRLQELGAALREAERDVEQACGRAATLQELAARLGVDESEVRAAREAAGGFHAMSIDLPDSPAGDPADESMGGDTFSAIDEADWLGRALAELTERERLVLALRFGEGQTQSQIAEQIGVSQMQVSRILRATLGRLRRLLQSSLETAA